MSLQVIKTAPDPTIWTPLVDHQSATPASFSAPVLHFHCANTQIALSSDQKSSISEFFPNQGESSSSVPVDTVQSTAAQDDKDVTTDESEGMVDEEDEGNWEEDTSPMIQDVTIENVDIYVTNSKFILWSSSLSTGYELTYPQITLHAITKSSTTGDSGIYMQVNTAMNTFDDYSEDDCLELTIYPPATSSSSSSSTNPANPTLSTSTTTTSIEDEVTTQTSSTQQQQQQPSETQTDLLYKSLTNCSNLHPEPRPSWSMGMDDNDDEEEDGNLNGGDGETDGIHHDYQNFDDADNDITILGGADSIGGIPALAPGGWITADNVDSIQWTIGGVSGRGDPNVSLNGGGIRSGLGPGAGTVRTRGQEEEDAHRNGVHADENGEDEVVDEEGVVTNGAGETKWRRTG